MSAPIKKIGLIERVIATKICLKRAHISHTLTNDLAKIKVPTQIYDYTQRPSHKQLEKLAKNKVSRHEHTHTPNVTMARHHSLQTNRHASQHDYVLSFLGTIWPLSGWYVSNLLTNHVLVAIRLWLSYRTQKSTLCARQK